MLWGRLQNKNAPGRGVNLLKELRTYSPHCPCYVALFFLLIRFTITLVMVSFSLGWLTAIISVKATRALSGIRFSPPLVKSNLFFSRKYKNKNAAILLLPSTNE